MSESGDAEGPWPSGKLQLFELERSLLHSGRMQAVRRAAAAAFSMQSPLSPPPCAAVVVVVPPVLSFFLPWNDCANAAVEMQGGPCRPPHSTVSKDIRSRWNANYMSFDEHECISVSNEVGNPLFGIFRSVCKLPFRRCLIGNVHQLILGKVRGIQNYPPNYWTLLAKTVEEGR